MKKYITALMAILVLLAMPIALAAPDGATVTVGATERGSSNAAGTASTEAGNVTEVNISGTAITSRWAGFYGNISAGLVLSDAANNKFYEWTVSDVSGAVVYATNASVSDWSTSNIVAATASDMPAFLTQSTADNYSNTYNAQEAFTSATYSIANTNYAATYSNGVAGNLKSYSLKATTENALIWAGKALDDETAFDGGQVDYQVLVPVDGTTTTTYNFYLELP